MAENEFQARQALFNIVGPISESEYTLLAMCGKCKDRPSEELHYCPYASEICDDHSEDYCDCCDRCFDLCARDI